MRVPFWIDDWIDEAKAAARYLLNTLAQQKDNKNAKLTQLMLALKAEFRHEEIGISAAFILIDHLLRVTKEDPVLFPLFGKIHDGMVDCLATDRSLFPSLAYELSYGNDLFTLHETTFFVIFHKAIENGNDNLVYSFLDEEGSLRKHIIQENTFKVCAGATEKKLEKFSPLILSAKNISKIGLSIFEGALSVPCSDYEYRTVLLMFVNDKSENAKKALKELLPLLENNSVRKKTILKYLAKNDGEVLFKIAEIGDIVLFGKILEFYASLQESAKEKDITISSITSLRKEGKTLFQAFLQRQNFQQLGNLEITGYIGSGTFSFVFKGRIGNEREVAVKYHNPEALETLSHEFEILKKVKGSEYIISPVELIKTQQMLAIVLDCAAGDLENLIKNNKLEVAQIPKTIIQLFAGLCVLHNNLIVYNDCKLTNILLTAEGNVKLADFGLSVVYPDKKIRLLPGGGTPLYWPPERLTRPWSSEILFDEATPADIYAAALVVWQIVTKEGLYSNFTSSEIKQKVIEGHRPDVSRLTDFKNLSIFTANCWADDPVQRHDANQAYTEITNIFK